MATLQENVYFARTTVEYVQGKMTIGAANKWSDVFGSLGQSLLCVKAMRTVGEEGIALPKDKSTVLVDYLRGGAMMAEDLGCGNCGEQAAIAFLHLEKLGVRPLDYMAFLPPGDHAFVVIGRTPQSDASDYLTWGEFAVVCDPWDERWFPAVQIPNEMHDSGKYKFLSLYRAEK